MSTVSTNWGPPAAAGWLERRECASEGSVPKRELHNRHSGPSELQRNSAPSSQPMRPCALQGPRGELVTVLTQARCKLQASDPRGTLDLT